MSVRALDWQPEHTLKLSCGHVGRLQRVLLPAITFRRARRKAAAVRDGSFVCACLGMHVAPTCTRRPNNDRRARTCLFRVSIASSSRPCTGASGPGLISFFQGGLRNIRLQSPLCAVFDRQCRAQTGRPSRGPSSRAPNNQAAVVVGLLRVAITAMRVTISEMLDSSCRRIAICAPAGGVVDHRV